MILPIKRYVIIGSYALGTRWAKDIDVVCYKDDIECDYNEVDDYVATFTHQGRKVECLLADRQESLKKVLESDFLNTTRRIARPAVLFGIKAGHITFPHRQWEKHVMDYHILKKLVQPDAVISVETNPAPQNPHDHLRTIRLPEFVKLHKKSTEERNGKKQKTPKLKGVTKSEFFDDFVVKYYEHDDIHAVVAHKEKPMYSYMQPDPNSVECSKEMWKEFTHEEKVQCVLEECYVIALERHIIPTLKGARVGLGSHDAFKWALMRVCTTLCSGWFRQFAIDNYFTILNAYNVEYPQFIDKL